MNQKLRFKGEWEFEFHMHFALIREDSGFVGSDQVNKTRGWGIICQQVSHKAVLLNINGVARVSSPPLKKPILQILELCWPVSLFFYLKAFSSLLSILLSSFFPVWKSDSSRAEKFGDKSAESNEEGQRCFTCINIWNTSQIILSGGRREAWTVMGASTDRRRQSVPQLCISFSLEFQGSQLLRWWLSGLFSFQPRPVIMEVSTTTREETSRRRIKGHWSRLGQSFYSLSVWDCSSH